MNMNLILRFLTQNHVWSYEIDMEDLFQTLFRQTTDYTMLVDIGTSLVVYWITLDKSGWVYCLSFLYEFTVYCLLDNVQ